MGSLAEVLAVIRCNTERFFYVYVLHRPDGTPFYVGCGKVQSLSRRSQRISFHEWQSRGKTQSHKCNAIRAIWRDGGQVRYSLDSWHDTERDMFAREIELIAQIGRADLGKGPLTNWSDGGDGLINRAEEAKDKARHSMSTRVTDEFRRACADRTRAHWATPEGRAKRQEANARAETKARKSEAARVIAAGPGNSKRAETMRAHWCNQAWRDRQSNLIAQAVRTEQCRAAKAEQSKERWRNPEYRQRLREIHRQRWARIHAANPA